MTIKQYTRVLPRDLFNEANLLKCLGRLFLLVDGTQSKCELVHMYNYQPFRTVQNDSNGAISVNSIWLTVNHRAYTFWRPLNSRASWPLYINTKDDVIQVFDEDTGNLSKEFKDFICFMKGGDRSE